MRKLPINFVLSALAVLNLAPVAAQPSDVPQLLADADRQFAHGDVAGAEHAARSALGVAEHEESPPGKRTAEALNALGGVFAASGRPAEAEPLYRRSLAIRRELFGVGSTEHSGTLNNLGYAIALQGRLDEAKAVYDQARAALVQSRHDQTPEFASVESNLGQLLVSQRIYADGERHLRAALSIRERLAKQHEPSLAAAYNNVAFAAAAQGHYEQATPLYERALGILEESLPKDHPEIGRALQNLADSLFEQGDVRRAEALLRRALEIRRKGGALLANELLVTENSLGELLLSANRPAEAAELFRAALATPGLAAADRPPLVANLALARLRSNDFKAAEPLYRELLSMSPPLDEEQRRATRINLAAALDGEARYSDAEQEFRSILQETPAHRADIRRGVRRRLIDTLISEKNYDAARTEAETLEQDLARGGTPFDPDRAAVLRQKLVIETAAGRWPEAQTALNRSRALIQTLYGPRSLEFARSLVDEAELLQKEGKTADAKIALAKAKALASSSPNGAKPLLDAIEEQERSR